jgi:catechol 2,3-dioxygenase-like lactoylglutathione lyase family enzyme
MLGTYGNQIMKLHWKSDQERRGIGRGISCANHIAITVSDVGNSVSFYSHVLGLQQLERPNFDRHGAWFTLGNVELHLIKGMPRVADGDDLIVSHVALESDDVGGIVKRLRAMNPPIDFQINVSVPTGDEKDIVD